MKRHLLTLPLKLTMLICILVFLSMSVYVLMALPAISTVAALAPAGQLPVALLSPLIGAALIALLSSFVFVRILFRRSPRIAKLYLLVIFVLSCISIYLDWQQDIVVILISLLWLVGLSLLYFSIKPVATS
jgi:hypothetical protein